MSTLDTTLRILPRLHAPRSWRLVERNIASSRGAWLVFVSGFFEPLFYLFAMGLLDSPWAVLAIPGALLVSAAFAAPSVYGITWMRSWADFAFIELCTLPMFLFSATFVPADTYPDVVRWILPLTPLYHGVELLRAFTLGDVSWLVLVNLAYLAAMTAVFLVLADRRLAKLLLK